MTDDSQDRIALQDVMLNYAAAVDERDVERYKACFSDDVQVVNFGGGDIHGRENWLAYVWAALERYAATQHLMGPQLARIENDLAYTRSDVQATHFLAEDPTQKFILWACYHTDMKKIDGQWKIIRHELVVRGTSAD